jgi:hypothetical protein
VPRIALFSDQRDGNTWSYSVATYPLIGQNKLQDGALHLVDNGPFRKSYPFRALAVDYRKDAICVDTIYFGNLADPLPFGPFPHFNGPKAENPPIIFQLLGVLE